MKTKTPDFSTQKWIKDVDETSVSLTVCHLSKNQVFEFIAKDHKILLVTTGILRCCLSGYVDHSINSGQMIFISTGTRCLMHATETVSVICLKLGLALNHYNTHEYDPKSLTDKLLENKPMILKFAPIISTYIESLEWFIRIKSKDHSYINIKTQELLYLISICYTLEERNLFFRAYVSKDTTFSDFIYQNYRKVKSINELANLSCYSRSGFEKRFRRIFGVPASHWITLRRASDIYHEIRRSKKSIKQICFDYDFSSLSHFHKFCKSKFGSSPGHIRKQLQIE